MSPPLDPASAPGAARRALRVLVAAQLLTGLGGSAAVAIALLAVELTHDDAVATLPLALVIVGAAATVVPVSELSRRFGRRAGLTVALAVAAAGAGGIAAAGILESFALLLAASVPFGAGTTAVMLARYAAADASVAGRRGRAMGLVVFATTFGAVAGPNLLEPSGRLAVAHGLPELTGIFVCGAAAFAAGALLLFVLLRPDPRAIAAALEEPSVEPTPPSRAPLRHVLAGPAALTGLVVMVVANLVMVSVMAMAPVHLDAHGHDLGTVGLVVSLHVMGMFAPAPVTGWLTDRLGPLPVAAAACALLTAAGLVSAAGGDGHVLTAGLVLLGVGWNAALVSGSTLLVSAVPLRERPRAEGVGEIGMGIAAAGGSAIAGPLVGLAGFAALGLGAAALAGALAPALAILARRGMPVGAAPAPRMLA